LDTFRRRIFDVAGFTRAVNDLLADFGDFKLRSRSPLIDQAFAERIMLAVTQVNGCRYCSFAHARAALAAGVDRGDIADLLQGDLAAVPAHQVDAVLFAQHYAETEGHPDDEAWQQLVATYGDAVAREILIRIRMITIGNLMGNTLDALLSRLRGRPAQASSMTQELGVLFGSVVIVPAAWIRRALARSKETIAL
jgi:AhpD family alkylhydroperoxidase